MNRRIAYKIINNCSNGREDRYRESTKLKAAEVVGYDRKDIELLEGAFKKMADALDRYSSGMADLIGNMTAAKLKNEWSTKQ